MFLTPSVSDVQASLKETNVLAIYAVILEPEDARYVVFEAEDAEKLIVFFSNACEIGRGHHLVACQRNLADILDGKAIQPHTVRPILVKGEWYISKSEFEALKDPDLEPIELTDYERAQLAHLVNH